jgi:putative acetyltransferase
MAPAVSPGLRPFLPSDAATLAALFRASVDELAAEDYSDDQRNAWASAADDEEAFAAKLAGGLTIVALVGGEIAGFATLKDNTLVDMLYVRPDLSGQGVGASLADAIERIAGARGAKKLTVEASDTARDFFARRGYVAQSRNTITVGGEWLGNTTMAKDLAAPSASGPH